MNIGYHQPSLTHIYAYRTIYEGYKDAFLELGHNFFTFTNMDNIVDFIDSNKIDLFITTNHFYYQKALDLDFLLLWRKKGGKMMVWTEPWRSLFPNNALRESRSLKDDYSQISLIKSGKMGDYFLSRITKGNISMDGFEKGTGYKWYSIPFACNPKQHFYDYDVFYKNDISYLGSRSKNKESDFRELLYPLRERGLKLYGQDWTWIDRQKGNIQRIGQYFNISILANIQKPKLPLDAERKIYSSTKINLNIHERPQKQHGGDCNERTFKIPGCGGFQIIDDVVCIRDYFKDGEEIVIARNKDDWFDKIKYYLNNPKDRERIIIKGMERVLKDHTYTIRAQKIIDIYLGNI